MRKLFVAIAILDESWEDPVDSLESQNLMMSHELKQKFDDGKRFTQMVILPDKAFRL